MRPVVYISGPITGVKNYQKNFKRAARELAANGCDVLNPAELPAGRTNAQYMRINFAMIEAAHAVLFLPGWEDSKGSRLEKAFADYIGKPTAELTEGGVKICQN